MLTPGIQTEKDGMAQTKQKGACVACQLSRTHIRDRGGPVQAGRLRHQAQTGIGYPDPYPGDEAVSNMSPQDWG